MPDLEDKEINKQEDGDINKLEDDEIMTVTPTQQSTVCLETGIPTDKDCEYTTYLYYVCILNDH